jgi:hypothetical protein
VNELIHPSTKVDDEPIPPETDGGYVEENLSRFMPRTLAACDGPGPLIREYEYSPTRICCETVEQCPTCDGTLQHRFRRVIRLEDQDESERNRLPGAPSKGVA